MPDKFYFFASPTKDPKEALIRVEEFRSSTNQETQDQIKQNALEAENLGKWIRRNLTGKCWEVIIRTLS